MNGETTLILTADEAEAFKQFMREREKIAVLQESGFFEMKNGQAIIDFASSGHIMGVSLSRKAWKRPSRLDKGNPPVVA